MLAIMEPKARSSVRLVRGITSLLYVVSNIDLNDRPEAFGKPHDFRNYSRLLKNNSRTAILQERPPTGGLSSLYVLEYQLEKPAASATTIERIMKQYDSMGLIVPNGTVLRKCGYKKERGHPSGKPPSTDSPSLFVPRLVFALRKRLFAK
jgi:hypothetical protein